MTEQDKTRNAELEASQARVEQNAAELQRHVIAGAALTEAANREVAKANAIDAQMTANKDALAAQKIATERAAERHASARNAFRFYVMTGLVVVILLAGSIYFYFNRQGAASAAQRETSVSVHTGGRPQGRR